MKLVWKGKLNKEKGFPITDLPDNAMVFLGEENLTSYIPIVVATLAFGITIFKIKQGLV